MKKKKNRMNAPFNNRQNNQHTLKDGRLLFESRSVAVMVMVIAYESSNDKFYALVGKRGPAVTSSNLWNNVCGYLDWDETLSQAMVREVFEETGLDLRVLEARGEIRIPSQPVFVASSPTVGRQNVTARFIVPLPKRVPIHVNNAEPDEVLDVEWMEVCLAELNKKEWAFNHKQLLLDLNDHLNGERLLAMLDENTMTAFADKQKVY